ncbi:MAG: hypothetical protein H6923_01390 [Alphaproteobacteria bacterium]|nr:hypothetical protein [Alphaproteobacteria bacterium]
MDATALKRRLLPYAALALPFVLVALVVGFLVLLHGDMRARIAGLDRDISLMERRLEAVAREARAVGAGEEGLGLSDLVAEGTPEVAAALASEEVTEAAQDGTCSLVSARSQSAGRDADAPAIEDGEETSEFRLSLDYRCPFEGVLAVLWHVATARPTLLADELTLAQAGADETGMPAFSLKLELRGFAGEAGEGG